MKEQDKNSPAFKSLNIDETIYKTIITSKVEKRKAWTPKDERLVTAFLPGTIVKLHVNVGDKVEIGDKLLILEAMKMKNILKSEVDGKVASINVTEGQSIPKGTVLLEIDPE